MAVIRVRNAPASPVRTVSHHSVYCPFVYLPFFSYLSFIPFFVYSKSPLLCSLRLLFCPYFVTTTAFLGLPGRTNSSLHYLRVFSVVIRFYFLPLHCIDRVVSSACNRLRYERFGRSLEHTVDIYVTTICACVCGEMVVSHCATTR